jgi:hypothetical protein
MTKLVLPKPATHPIFIYKIISGFIPLKRRRVVDSHEKASTSGLSERESRFLTRLAQKYETDENAGQVRSYLIAAAVILSLFALARWLPWWEAAAIGVLSLGMTLFHQYKRFTRFKTRILVKMWRERGEVTS